MDIKQYTKSYVAFLDILGFKNLVYEQSCNDILEVFKISNKKPFAAIYLGGTNIVSESTASALKVKIMSDSICLCIDIEQPNALLCILFACLQIQIRLLSRPHPLFLRGAIACGDVYVEDDVIFGPGLTQAYLMEANNAKYPRIILTSQILENMEWGDMIPQALVFEDFDAFYTVNYFFAIIKGYLTTFEKIISTINNVLSITTDNSIREKYVYMKKMLEQMQELNEKSLYFNQRL